MNLPFEESYNNPTNEVYKDIEKVIESKCREHITNLQSVKLLNIRSGSTIAQYEVRAPSINVKEIENVTTGIFSELSKNYSMIYDGESLKFDPQETFFFGQRMTVKCGPPPNNLGEKWTAEWTRDNKPIVRDEQHNILKENGQSILTVDSFFSDDKGRYECKLKYGESYFRQTGEPKAEEKPEIRVTPVQKLVECKSTSPVTLTCSVDDPYKVKFNNLEGGPGNEITQEYSIPENCEKEVKKFSCQLENNAFVKSDITLEFTKNEIKCFDVVYGSGTLNFKAVIPCDDENKVGNKTAVCSASGEYIKKQDNCVLKEVQKLLEQSESITEERLPVFLDQLSNVTVDNTEDVTDSPATIKAIVTILENVANASLSLNIPINSILMEDVLLTTGILTSDSATESWVILNSDQNNTETQSNSPETTSFSSSLLQSLEDITKSLNNESFNIDTEFILLNKTTFTDSFNEEFDSSVEVEIPEADGGKKSITVITFSSMDNVLPAREESNSSSNSINGRVVLIQSSGKINNISITFDILNDTLGNPKCVFWNFSLLDGLGGWDDEGCSLVVFENETVSCNCNHLTSFSILMSPYSPNNPTFEIITYVGVGISLASLVICLIIEAVIWKKIRRNTTSYLRHVSIVNIAVSLLIANIWFIIGAAISDADKENPEACSTATFFIHFFYLSLFFWMLASALLLLYRTVSVFDGGLSKMAMLAIGFSLGYGAPLIIATITIAVTAPKEEYTRDNNVCWLKWEESKALLAFVIPALLIVLINLIILVVVVYKMLRRRVGGNAAQAAEKHVLAVIARCVAVLTPFFGLTWGLGIGIMFDPGNKGIHIAFAFFNSLQGFFILVFGTLLDKKVRSELTLKSQTSQSGTTSTSAGFSFSNLGIFRKFKQKRGSSNGFNVSSNASESQSFTNT
ncbi:adhesion G protein-coupled receptor F5 [Leuresthes tenuis]|uniref:adhesion G protein-coupled receptor F5 n=1 Tax=Leuresthes tenuis TaxID=355514 RepID=UPI003B5022BE